MTDYNKENTAKELLYGIMEQEQSNTDDLEIISSIDYFYNRLETIGAERTIKGMREVVHFYNLNEINQNEADVFLNILSKFHLEAAKKKILS